MFSESSICIRYMEVVNLNSDFDTCYSVDPIVGNISYMHEVLACLLFIYGGLVDF
jgi:hypothetical protein